MNRSDSAEAALDSAADAVKSEYREATRPRKLRCLGAERLPEGIMVLRVGSTAALDISWEGSTAFRPTDLAAWDGGFPEKHELRWSGEVVEVDAIAGRIYVVVDARDARPENVRGTFFVREFPYLGPLRTIFHDAEHRGLRDAGLAEHLRATLGEGEADRITDNADATFAGAEALRAIWPYRLSYLWGPPGTGKTFTIGEHVARAIVDTNERFLIASTTNKATDEVALAIGRALERAGRHDVFPGVVRVGKGGSLRRFEAAGLAALLDGSEAMATRVMADLAEDLRRAESSEDRARLRAELTDCRQQLRNGSIDAALDPGRRAVVTTSFNALTMLLDEELRARIERNESPFTTVIVDEAGLISRASTAALALHAKHRVMLAGDPKQLAPVSRISRVLPPARARWLARSALSHLSTARVVPASTMLDCQWRMHTEVREVVSRYQYAGRLRDADAVRDRPALDIPLLEGCGRALWYVLDEDQDDLAKIRADRGPGNKSWVRDVTVDVVSRLLAAAPELAARPGLFLSPFLAQAKRVDEWLKRESVDAWRASTIHAQQGAEADVVVFDTVNAGSHVWPIDEWKRLVNVALSRAREFAIVVSSRSEMREPYLRELKSLLDARVLRWRGSRYFLKRVDVTKAYDVPDDVRDDPVRLGAQLASRRAMRPLLSREQERLCRLDLDGKPRLVRGVAGSGKTVILANWLARAAQGLASDPGARIWVVYANKSLRSLIDEAVDDAWREVSPAESFPWDQVAFWHIQDLLRHLGDRFRLARADFGFDYEAGARTVLDRAGAIEPLCRGLFVDEAQDLGDDTLRLLAKLVETSDASDANSKSFVVFYDNAQNVYRRATPVWSDLGIDMRGRSAVLKESFRSTQPISEFALNVLYRLRGSENDADHRELVRRQLIERTSREGSEWWRVNYNQVHGPLPVVRTYRDLDAEMAALGDRVRALVTDEGVRPSDVRVLYMGSHVASRLATALPRALAATGVRVEKQTSRAFSDDEDVLVYTTPHSFKGYDAEVVLVAAADEFRSRTDGVNAAALYVALTRARSILEVFARHVPHPDGAAIVNTLVDCDEDARLPDDGDPTRLDNDDIEELVRRFGDAHAAWIRDLNERCALSVEPIVSPAGEVLAHADVHFMHNGVRHACNAGGFRPAEAARLDDAGVVIIRPGAAIDRP